MNRTTRLLLIVLLLPVLVLTACKPAALEPPGDQALRSMLRINSLAGSFTLPPGEDYFQIAVCNYEDGKLIKRKSGLFGYPPKYKWDRLLKLQLLWGNVGGKVMVSASCNGNGGGPGVEDPFWSHLEGGCSSIPNSRETSPDGWVVLGYACSGKAMSIDFRQQLESSKRSPAEFGRYVGALALRTYKSEAELRRAIEEDTKAAQEAPKEGAPSVHTFGLSPSKE